MSKSVDQKIVEMRFDNQQFENNVRTSLTTLDRLKQALSFKNTSTGLENLSRTVAGISFTGLENALGTVSVSFSALQTVADTVFRRITNAAIDTATTIERYLVGSITQGGWSRAMNIENAKFMLEGLKVAWKDIVDDINYGVQDTAYGLDAAARVASQLVASGVTFGETSDQMRTALRGISGVAAMTNSTYEDIGHIFTTVAGQGKMMTMQLRQLELRGLNVAAIMAEQMGTTEEAVREMITKGEINFEIFSKAMDEAFGEHAKDANKTFTGALSNIRSALGRIGAEVATPLIQNSISVLNAIRERINEVKKSLDPFYSRVKDLIEIFSERWTYLIKNVDLSWISRFFNSLDFSNVIPMLDRLKDGFGAVWSLIKRVKEAFDEVFVKKFETVIKNVQKPIEKIVESADRLKKPFEEFDKVLGLGFETGLTNAANGAKRLKDNVLGFDKVLESTDATYSKSFLVKFVDGVKDILSAFTLTDDRSEKLQKTLEGIFRVFKVIGKFVDGLKPVIEPIKTIFSDLFDLVLNVGNAFGLWMEDVDKFTDDKFNVFGEKLAEWLSKAWTFLKDISKISYDKFKEFIDLFRNTEMFSDFKTLLGDIYSKIQEKIEFPTFETFGNTVSNIFDKLKPISDFIGTVIRGIIEHLDNFWKRIKEYGFVQILKDAVEIVKTILGGLVDFVKDIIGQLDGENGTSFTDVFNTILGLLGIEGIRRGAYAIRSALGVIKTGFPNITESIFKISDAVQTMGIYLKRSVDSSFFKTIAEAVLMLAGAALILSVVDPEKLNRAISAITIMIAELVASMKILTAGAPSSGIKAISQLIVFSTSVLVLCLAIRSISDLNIDQILKGVVGIGLLLGELVGVVALLQLLGGAEFGLKKSMSLVILGAALKIMVSVLKDIVDIDDFDKLTNGLLGLGIVLNELAIFMGLLTKLNGGGLDLKNATSLVILGASLKILVSVLKDIINIGDTDTVTNSLISLGVLLTELAMFMGLLKIFENGGLGLKNAISLVILGASLKIVVGVVKDIGVLTTSEFERGFTGLGLALLGLAGTIAILGNLDSSKVLKASAAMLLVSGALSVASGAFMALSALSWGQVEIAGTSLGIALGAIVGALYLLNDSKVMAGAGAIAIVSVGLLLLASSMKILASMSQEGALIAAISLAGAITIIAIALRALSDPWVLVGAGAILIVAASLLLLAPALLALSAISGKGIALALLSIAGALAIFLAASAAAIVLAPGIIALAGGLLMVGAAVALLGVGLLAVGAGLAALATGILAVLKILPNIAEVVAGFIIGVVRGISDALPQILDNIKDILISVIGILVECIPALVSGIMELITELLKALVTYIPQIVDLLFNFALRIIETLTTRLPELATAVINLIVTFFEAVVDAVKDIGVERFASALQGFEILSLIVMGLAGLAVFIPPAMVGVLLLSALLFELSLCVSALSALAGMKDAIETGGEVLSTLGYVIGNFVGAIVGGFAAGVSTGFPVIAENLSLFMTNLQPFIEGANNISDGSIQAVRSLVEVILLLTAADLISSLTAWVSGSKTTLSDFGKELAEFGPYFNQYYESVKGMDGDVIVASSNAAKALSEMASNLPRDGGIWGKIAGDRRTLANFAEELAAFGPGFKTYADSVQGIDSSAVTNSATAAQSMAELASKLPRNGGLWGQIAGDSDLSSFAKELEIFGPAFMAYSKSISGLDANVVTNSANAAMAMANLANELPNTGGLIAWFTGDNDLGTFGEKLQLFGSCFAEYSKSVTGLDIVAIDSAERASQTLIQFTRDIETVDLGKLTTFGDNILVFSRNLLNYSVGVSEISVGQMGLVSAELKNLIDILKGIRDVDTSKVSNFGSSLTDLGNSGIDGFLSAFTDADARVREAVANFIKKFVDGINGNVTIIRQTFSHIMDDLLGIITSRSSNFFRAGQSLTNSIVSGAASVSSDLSSLGYNLSNSFTASIESTASISNAYNAGATLASAAKDGARAALRVNSPSKEGEEIAYYYVIGFTNELYNMVGASYEAGSEVGKAAKDGLQKAIESATSFISDEELQPVVRPVLDLSEIQNGRGLFSKLMGEYGANPLDGSYGFAGLASSHMNKQSSDLGIAGAIDKMSRELSKMSDKQPTTFENVFNVTSNDPEQFANDVSRILARQTQRVEAQYGFSRI